MTLLRVSFPSFPTSFVLLPSWAVKHSCGCTVVQTTGYFRSKESILNLLWMFSSLQCYFLCCKMDLKLFLPCENQEQFFFQCLSSETTDFQTLDEKEWLRYLNSVQVVAWRSYLKFFSRLGFLCMDILYFHIRLVLKGTFVLDGLSIEYFGTANVGA